MSGASVRRGAAMALVPGVLLLVALGYVALATRLGVATRAVPLLAGIFTALMCVLDAVSRSDTPAGRAVCRWLNPATGGEAAVTHRHHQVLAVAGVVVLALGMVLVGLLASVFLFAAGALRLRAGRGWPVAVATACGLTAVIWALFHLVLGLHLFPGLLFGGEW